MKLIIVPLAMLIFSSLFWAVTATSRGTYEWDLVSGYWVNVETGERVVGNFTAQSDLADVDQQSKIQAGVQPFNFGIDDATGLLIAVVATVAFMAVAGITVVGSGLNDSAVKAVGLSAFYYGVWIMFSLVGQNAFKTIPIVGTLIYIFLTVLYSLGVMEQIG